MVLTFFRAIREAVKGRMISGRLIEQKTEVHDTARGQHGKFLPVDCPDCDYGPDQNVIIIL